MWFDWHSGKKESEKTKEKEVKKEVEFLSTFRIQYFFRYKIVDDDDCDGNEYNRSDEDMKKWTKKTMNGL